MLSVIQKAFIDLLPCRIMLHLRTVGFDWKEIAAALKTTDCAARAEFSREIRRLRGESSSGNTCSRSQKAENSSGPA